jgi:hypothetical protein
MLGREWVESGVAGVQESQELQNKRRPGGCFSETEVFSEEPGVQSEWDEMWVMN